MRTAVILRTLVFTSFMFLFSCTKDDIAELEIINAVSDTQLETQVITLINEHRTVIGMSTLAFNSIAYSEANTHNDYMIAKGILSHDNFNSRASKIFSEANANQIGENIAKGPLTSNAVFEGWIRSTDHKANIEGDFTHTAISVKKDGNGTTYYTQIFFK